MDASRVEYEEHTRQEQREHAKAMHPRALFAGFAEAEGNGLRGVAYTNDWTPYDANMLQVAEEGVYGAAKQKEYKGNRAAHHYTVAFCEALVEQLAAGGAANESNVVNKRRFDLVNAMGRDAEDRFAASREQSNKKREELNACRKRLRARDQERSQRHASATR